VNNLKRCTGPTLTGLTTRGMKLMEGGDRQLHDLLNAEQERQFHALALVASSSYADPSTLAATSTVLGNITTEGYPRARFHAGCQVVDLIEELAIDRAKRAFGACYANVQPHSGSSANLLLLFGLLEPGDTILGLGLPQGGHLTHGAAANVVGKYFHPVHYGVGVDGRIDYDQVRHLALTQRPKVIIAGASSYPRIIEFYTFRQIADEVNALLLADISHIAGLVVAGQHPSPIDSAHFTTTSTYKQLCGPRGGMILIGRDAESRTPDGRMSLAQLTQKLTFPFFQGTPNLSAIAAKAAALQRVMTGGFKSLATSIVVNARALASALELHGYRIVTGGTDNHMVVIDLSAQGLSGFVAEKMLDLCGITVNRNVVPDDRRPVSIASGLRLGTNCVTQRGMGVNEMHRCADLVHRVLSCGTALNDLDYFLAPMVVDGVRQQVEELCAAFPIPGYIDGSGGYLS